MRTAGDETAGSTVVLVPVKRFDQAKLRLAEVLQPAERAHLAQTMAEQVVRAAAPLPTFVVCEEERTAEWAAGLGVGVIEVDCVGLNPAVGEAVRRVEQGEVALPDGPATAPATGTAGSDFAHGPTHVLVAHGDLPQARSFAGLARPGAVVIVPDRHLAGTNVMSVPLRCGFEFHYGSGSLHAHVSEALRRGLDVAVRRVPELECDVDMPDDLAAAHLPTPQPA